MHGQTAGRCIKKSRIVYNYKDLFSTFFWLTSGTFHSPPPKKKKKKKKVITKNEKKITSIITEKLIPRF